MYSTVLVRAYSSSESLVVPNEGVHTAVYIFITVTAREKKTNRTTLSLL